MHDEHIQTNLGSCIADLLMESSPWSKVPPLERRMTKLLRHNTEGEYIRSDGFMLLSILMILLGATEEQVREIVNSSKKNGASRFEIVTDLVHSTGKWIRAKRKHTNTCVKHSRVAEPIESCLVLRPPPRYTRHYHFHYNKHFWFDRRKNRSVWEVATGKLPKELEEPPEVIMSGSGECVRVSTNVGDDVSELRMEIAGRLEREIRLVAGEKVLADNDSIPDSLITCIVQPLPGKRYYDANREAWYWHSKLLSVSRWEQKQNAGVPPNGWVKDEDGK